MTHLWKAWLVGVMGLGVAGCLPAHLEKYSKNKPSQPAPDPVAGVQPNSGTAMGGGKSSAPARTVSSAPSAIQSLSKNTFRFRLPEGQVWDSAIGVLLNNYNITTLDRESGVITTEWDTFYLNDKVFRNKVTMHVKKSAWNAVDVALYNNVEVLQENGKGPSMWLPAKKGVNEVNRIVKNMAIYLNQPQPSFPDEMVARAGGDTETK